MEKTNEVLENRIKQLEHIKKNYILWPSVVYSGYIRLVGKYLLYAELNRLKKFTILSINTEKI